MVKQVITFGFYLGALVAFWFVVTYLPAPAFVIAIFRWVIAVGGSLIGLIALLLLILRAWERSRR